MRIIKRFRNNNYILALPQHSVLFDLLCKLTPDATYTRLHPQLNVADHRCLIEITLEELRYVLKSTRMSSPGIDIISHDMLSNLPENAQLMLLQTSNQILENRIPIPEMWKSEIIHPILKPDKNPKRIESYRPCVSLFVSKILEKIIAFRLDWICESNRLLHPHQYGFRRGKKTTEACLHLLLDLECFQYEHSSYFSRHLSCVR